MPKKGEYVKLENYERKIKLSLIISVHFESVFARIKWKQKSRRVLYKQISKTVYLQLWL